jgi:hypothetical protein
VVLEDIRGFDDAFLFCLALLIFLVTELNGGG